MNGEALKLIRVYHNLSQTQLAAELGISKSHLSGLESGAKNVSLSILEKYATHFDIPVSSLMLFMERSVDPKTGHPDARALVSKKALRMLHWIADISGAHENESTE